jgi:hypothetical protein
VLYFSNGRAAASIRQAGEGGAALERVKRAATELEKALETCGNEAKDLIDEFLPALETNGATIETNRATIQRQITALNLTCWLAKTFVLDARKPDRNPRDGLLEWLGDIYPRASGKKPAYSMPKGKVKPMRPYGPFVRFCAIIAKGLLPSLVESSDMAYAVKNRLDRKRALAKHT